MRCQQERTARAACTAGNGSGLPCSALLCRWLLEPLQGEVLAELAAAALEEGLPPEARDVETRVNAVKSLGRVTLALLAEPEPGKPGDEGWRAAEQVGQALGPMLGRGF